MERADPDEMATSECWDRLKSTSLGRLGLSISALPAILPVQYYVEGDALAICLGHYTYVGRAVDNAVVAFAADAIDSTTGLGWTVQVQGRSRIRKDLGAPVDCGQPAAGQIMHVEPVTVSGHRVRLCPFVTDLGEH
jgi:hypothetical protein